MLIVTSMLSSKFKHKKPSSIIKINQVWNSAFYYFKKYLRYEAGCSGLVHWDDPDGWDGEGGGQEGQDVGHVYTHGWFMWIYGKNHYNIIK